MVLVPKLEAAAGKPTESQALAIDGQHQRPPCLFELHPMKSEFSKLFSTA